MRQHNAKPFFADEGKCLCGGGGAELFFNFPSFAINVHALGGIGGIAPIE